MQQLIILALSLISSWHHGSGEYANYLGWQWSVGCAFLTIPMSFYFLKRLGLPFALLFSYIAIYSCSIFGQWGKYNLFSQQDWSEVTSANAFSSLLFFLVFIPILEMKNLRKIVPWFTSLNAGYVIFNSFTEPKLPGGTGWQGLIDYSGLNGVMIASCLSFLIFHKSDAVRIRVLKSIGLALSIWAVILSSSAISIGVLGIVLVTRFKQFWLTPLILSGGMMAVGAKMFDSSFRFQAYRLFIKEIFDRHFEWFGTGLGTFIVFSYPIQLKYHFMTKNIWAWAHSDYPVQTFFELGYVGLALVTLVLIDGALKLSRKKDRELFPTYLALMGGSLFDYPIRYFPSACLCAFVLIEALRSKLPEHYERPAKAALFICSLIFTCVFFIGAN